MSDNADPADLRGRTILVTGAGDGFGAALARAAAAAGAEVILLGRSVRKLESVYDDIAAAGGPEAAILPVDLEGATPQDYIDVAGHVESACGRLDALVHNAAMLGSQTPLEHYPALEWARTLQVNLTGPLLLTQACLPLLRLGTDPVIAFVDDERRGAYWGAYGVSKAAAAAMADILAQELEGEPGIRVARYAPGPMRTPLRSRAFPGALPDEAPPPEDAAAGLLALLAAR